MKHDEAKSPVKHILGANIRALRLASGQSQSKFAEMIGVNRSYVNQIEAGRMNVSVGILEKVANGLDVPLTELFAGMDACPPRNLSDGNSYALVEMPESDR